ncbi:MAG: nucleotidyltransferase family protein [Pseudomonadota bacterium]
MALDPASDHFVFAAPTRFVGLCCRWPQTDENRARLDRIARTEITDWDAVWQEIERHRVLPLVAHTLHGSPDLPVPDTFRAACKEAARQITMRGLRQLTEARSVEARFVKAGLNPVHFKGPTLAAHVFGSPAFKACKDIDIYVPPDQAAAAMVELTQMGFRPLEAPDGLTPRLQGAILRHMKDLEFIGPPARGQVQLELHWRVSSYDGINRRVLSGLSEGATTTAGLTLPEDADHFAYLCQHGANHEWARLKWLADVAALWETSSEAVRADFLERARARGVLPACAQALHLARDLIGTSVDAQTQLPAVPALLRHAQSHIAGPYYTTSRRARAQRHLGKLWVHWRYMQGWRELPQTVSRFLVSPRDIFALPLPRALDWVYVVIRLPSYIYRALSGR